ncbi:MAG TPA: YtxH domain-containing protein [Candidatus Angelobacter sp.]
MKNIAFKGVLRRKSAGMSSNVSFLQRKNTSYFLAKGGPNVASILKEDKKKKINGEIIMLKFLTGIAAGIGVGLLLAPKAGSQTREQLVRLTKQPGEVAREKIEDLQHKVGEFGADIGRQMAEAAIDKVVPKNLSSGSQQRSG